MVLPVLGSPHEFPLATDPLKLPPRRANKEGRKVQTPSTGTDEFYSAAHGKAMWYSTSLACKAETNVVIRPCCPEVSHTEDPQHYR